MCKKMYYGKGVKRLIHSNFCYKKMPIIQKYNSPPGILEARRRTLATLSVKGCHSLKYTIPHYTCTTHSLILAALISLSMTSTFQCPFAEVCSPPQHANNSYNF